MYLDGYKYWLAYKKGNKSYFRCSRSKSQKCPGKLIMEDSKVVTFIQHDHEKEARNNAVEKFRKVLTKKAIEKPNKQLVDIYLEETLNHSEASILYPFSQAESTMRKARSKALEEKLKSDGNGNKNEENSHGSARKVGENSAKIDESHKLSAKSQQHQKFFYVESINEDDKIILMNQGTLKVLGKIEEIHIDCGMKIDVIDQVCGEKLIKNHEILEENKRKSKNSTQSTTIHQETTSSIPIFYTIHQNTSTIVGLHENLDQNQQILEETSQISLEPNEIHQLEAFIVNYEDIIESNPKTIANPLTFNLELPKLVQISTKVQRKSQILSENCENSSQSERSLNKNFESAAESTKNSHKANKSFEDCSTFADFSSNFGPRLAEIQEKAENTEQHMTNLGSCSKTINSSTFRSNSCQKSCEQSENPDQHMPNLTPCAKTSTSSAFDISFNPENNKTSQNIPNLVFCPETVISSEFNSTLRPETYKIPQNPDQHMSTSSIPISTQFPFQNTSHRFQLITIIALIKGRDCPIAFGLLKSPNPQSIHNFLRIFNQKIPLDPSTILTSPNEFLQQSIHSIYPESTIKVMYFYYAQSVLGHVQKNLTKNIFEISSLKMILSMPMIPTNYVVPGWEALRKWMHEKNVNLDGLCEDVYSKWLAENAEKISIFNGLTHSINNHTQVFQNDLINCFGGASMTVDVLVEKISRQATRNFLKFTKTSESLAKKIQKLQKTVKIATKNWISSPFHLRRPIQFLQQVSHCIDDGMINFVMNFDGNFLEVRKIEPPPLVFYEDVEKGTRNCEKEGDGMNNVGGISEPPPLVLIRR